MTPEPRPRSGIPAFTVAAFALAFLVTVAYVQQTERTRTTATRRDRLAALVVDRQQRAAGIQAELAALHARAEALRRSGGDSAALQAEIERLAAFAGTARVRGPGLAVTMSDSPLSEDEGSPDFLIQDIDVQLAVNELWSAGAEAISINGQRLVATTAIRSAGRAVLVNYKVLTSPYRILAVGDPETLERRFAASTIAARFRTWSEIYRLSMKVERRDSIDLPAYGGGLRLAHASPAAAPSPSPKP